MATTNFNCDSYFSQIPLNGLHYHVSSCKIEASLPQVRHSPIATMPPPELRQEERHRVLISNDTYYGHHHVKPFPTTSSEETRPMDCEMVPISSYCTPESAFGRKRPSGDVSFANIKRLKQEDTKKKEIKKSSPTKRLSEDSLLKEELLQGIHGCSLFHMLQQECVL